MRILLDSNILTRMVEPGSPQHQLAADAAFLLATQGHTLYLVPQTLYEFWVVCTRPIASARPS